MDYLVEGINSIGLAMKVISDKMVLQEDLEPVTPSRASENPMKTKRFLIEIGLNAAPIVTK
jgi:hypothetical protein